MAYSQCLEMNQCSIMLDPFFNKPKKKKKKNRDKTLEIMPTFIR